MWKITTVILLALIVRLLGIGWDSGFHFHPDERMLIMVADRIRFPFQLNPHFFNYGSFPIYLLKGISEVAGALFHRQYATYDGMLIVGRGLAIAFDLITVLGIYQIGLLLNQRDRRTAILAAIFYSVAVFPIQNAHFFVVDVLLTTETTLLILTLLLYLKKPRLFLITIIGALLGISLATKFSALFLWIGTGAILLTQQIKLGRPKRNWKQAFFNIFTTYVLATGFFFFFMPYAFLDHVSFSKDISQQIKMNSNPYIFPYTLQYVGTLPYLYYLKQVFFWGLGPTASTMAVLGLIMVAKQCTALFKKSRAVFSPLLVYGGFYLLYFVAIGQTAVKFMRYLLPVYPFFAVLTGWGVLSVYHKLKGTVAKLFVAAILLQVLASTQAFLFLYESPNTRLRATDWILSNVPAGKTLAVEHWDDRLPVRGQENYRIAELPLYLLPDDEKKWAAIQTQLHETDYLIIASNRLYVPLMKLKDCRMYRVCYPKTAAYYEKLFSGRLGFQKVAEFTSFPTLKFGPLIWRLPDETADESFTVYDHPKIMIFHKL